MSNTVDILEQMRAKGWMKRTVTPTHFQYRLGKMPYRSNMDEFMRLLHNVARTVTSFGPVQPSQGGEFFYQVAKPKPKAPTVGGVTGLVVEGGWDKQRVKAATVWVLRDLKDKWAMPKPLDQIVLKPHRYTTRWNFTYSSRIVIAIGLKVKWPQDWLGARLENWLELYILSLAWATYAYMRTSAGHKTTSKECNEIACSVLHRYRVANIDMDLVLDKADYEVVINEQ